MRFAEEILLLPLKEDTGFVVSIPRWLLTKIGVNARLRFRVKRLRHPVD